MQLTRSDNHARALPPMLAERTANSSRLTMRKPCRFVVAFWTAVLVGIVWTPSAEGQVSTTGQIRGRVQDSEGQPVSGVTVAARNVDTGFERTAESADDGFFIIRLLSPGTYTVTTRMLGFQAVRNQGVQVSLGASTPLNISLSRVAVELAAIEVTGERAPIDVADGGVTQLVSREEIEQLPSLGRNFVDFINLSGLVAPDPGETTGGQFAIGGQRASQTSVQIDGVDANNSFFGEGRGGSRIPFVFSLESLQEFQIITNGFDVEHGSFSGGIVNVVTRGGTNQFEGTVYGNFRNDALTARPFIDAATNAEITTDYEVLQVAGRFSGPIVRDKAFFLASVDGQRRREPQLPLTRSRFGPGGSDEDPAIFDDVGRFFSVLQGQYGVADAEQGYRTFQTSNDAITLFGRIDWALNENHRLSLRHNFSTFSNDNEWNGVFDFEYGLSRAEKLEDRSHSFVAEVQSVLGPKMFNVFRFQFSDETRPRQGKELRPTISVNLSNGQRIRYGGSFASFNNRLDERKFQFINNLTRVAGDHTFKVGGNLLYTNIFNRFMFFGSQFQGAGEFVFASLDDIEAFRPSSYFRPIQEGCPPGQFEPECGIPTSTFDVVEWAAYIQDTWQMTPKLTATIGLRYDQQSFRDSPTPVVDVERAFGFETGFAPTDGDNVSGRLSLAYDLKGDGSSVVRAGAGYFYSRVPYVVGGNVLQTERPVLEVICSGSIIDGDPDAPPSPADYGSWRVNGYDNPTSCADVGAGGVPTYTFWNPGFEYPESFKANIGFETLIGRRSQVSIDFLFSQSINLYTVRNLNLRDVQFQLDSEGGRRVFTPAASFDPTSANLTGSRRNLEFGDVLVNFKDGRARSFVTTLEGTHDFSENISVRASYTFTKAYDNSPYSCCTASGGYADPTTGAFGPNEIGGLGDNARAWGISDYSREHAITVLGFMRLPLDIRLSAFWKSQSGRPWTVVGDDDLNGDGITGNDRIFVYAPANLPLASTGAAADEERALYASILRENSCAGDYQGRIIERNTCRFPWTHQLDIRFTKGFNTVGRQRAEIQVDFFNVLNGIGRLLCDEDAADFDPTSGVCGLGRLTGVFGSDRELLDPRGFDAGTGQILYQVNDDFGEEDLLGANLVRQFQLQLAFRYFF